MACMLLTFKHRGSGASVVWHFFITIDEQLKNRGCYSPYADFASWRLYIFLIIIFITDISYACLQRVKQGPCLANFARYFFNVSSLQCEPFAWGGCFPNDNNFLTYDACLQECACSLPADGGNVCHANIRSWYHDNGVCKEFSWTGCAGNANRFDSKLHCLKTCR